MIQSRLENLVFDVFFLLLLLFSTRKYLFAFVFAGLGFVSAAVNRPVQVFGSILEERRVGQTDAFALQGW